MAHEPGLVDILLADGRRIRVRATVADRVRGVDADGDVVITLGTPDSPIRHDDGTDYLILLSPGVSSLARTPRQSFSSSVAMLMKRSDHHRCRARRSADRQPTG